MSTQELDELVAHAKQHFEEGLIRAGFAESEEEWRGLVVWAGGSANVKLTLPLRFPFAPPKVLPTDDLTAEWSWHRNGDGSLCFVADDDHEGLWWVEASNVLEQVAAWFSESQAGWPEDRPDLDLERYFEASDDKNIYIYGELSPLRNSHVRIESGTNATMWLRIGARAKLKSKKPAPIEIFGYVADLGEIDSPPRNWSDIEARITLGASLTRQIEAGSLSVIGLIYDRGGHEGLILLRVQAEPNGAITAKRLVSSAETVAARRARSGPHVATLSNKTVAVVGVGALGSFIAEGLARSGIGGLTLVDSDFLLPGNLVRHAATSTLVGRSKVEAVQLHLAMNDHIDVTKIKTLIANVLDTSVAVRLLASHDLVVNATADFAVTAVLHYSAAALDRHVLSAAIQNGGSTFRLDLLPPLNGATPLASSSATRTDSQPHLFEAGCGSPVSPTPPYVVMEAAGAAVRHAVNLLADAPIDPAGEVRHLTSGKQ